MSDGSVLAGNRKKEPLYLFAALQRHLGYPAAPRNLPRLEDAGSLQAKLSQLETRVKMMEEEQRSGAVDLGKLFPRPKNL